MTNAGRRIEDLNRWPLPAIPGGAVAVVLAAGAGRRFAGPDHKLLAPWRGRPLVMWALENALAARLGRTWVVTGAIDLIAAGVVPPGVEVLVNGRWAEGQSTSLQMAVRAAAATPGVTSLVIGLGDQPLIPPSAWQAVASSSGRPMAVASYGGRHRNPVRIDRRCWTLLPASGDHGARILTRQRPDLVMAVECEGDPTDIDTVADLTTSDRGGGD